MRRDRDADGWDRSQPALRARGRVERPEECIGILQLRLVEDLDARPRQAGGGHTGAMDEMSREAAVVDFSSGTGWASRFQHRHSNSQGTRDRGRMFGAGDQRVRHVSALARDDGRRAGEHAPTVTARALGWRTRNAEATRDLRAHTDHTSLRHPSLHNLTVDPRGSTVIADLRAKQTRTDEDPGAWHASEGSKPKPRDDCRHLAAVFFGGTAADSDDVFLLDPIDVELRRALLIWSSASSKSNAVAFEKRMGLTRATTNGFRYGLVKPRFFSFSTTRLTAIVQLQHLPAAPRRAP